MIKTKWNVEAVKAYETGQGVELVNEPYPHYVPSTTESEKQEQGEPVGWIDNKGNMICTKINESCKPLYTTPQTKKWAGLTENQIDKLEKEFIGFPVPNIYNFVKAIETKLKENT